MRLIGKRNCSLVFDLIGTVSGRLCVMCSSYRTFRYPNLKRDNDNDVL